MAARFGSRALPPSPAARIAALGLGPLVVLDLGWQLALAGRTLLWLDLAALLAGALNAPAATPLTLGVACDLAALLLALLLWFVGGRLVAILLALAVAWELYARIRQVIAALSGAAAFDAVLLSGVVGVLLLTLVAIVALAGTFAQSRRRRWWR